jgi:FkbM family methyltransferase
MALGLFEPAESRLIRELLGPRDTFVDVGAHIGWFTTIAAQCVGEDGLVIACEPYPPNVAALKENLELNSAENVRLVDMALGSQPGTLSLGFAADSGATTALDWGPCQRVEAPMTTLDKVTAEVSSVTVMKMDVEGWEAHVLRGGSEALARTEHVLMEINRPVLKKAGSSSEELYGLLRNSGFKTFIPVTQRGLLRLVPDDDLVNVLVSR